MKLRLGFLGLGAMGLSHLKAMQRLTADEADISAICDLDANNLAQAAAAAPSARKFSEAKELFGSEVDAIFVSTPNFTHAESAEQIVAAGKHLFLEKPCGITSAECKRVLAAGENARRTVMLGHELRYSPFFQSIKDMVAAGEVGRPLMAWTKEFRGPFQKKVGNWIQDERRSGGCLVDKNCHHFDLMNWWLGARPRRVSAFGGCAVNRVIPGDHQVHDHATVSVEYENQARASLQLCMFALDFPNEDLEMGVIGDGGMLATRISRIEILQWKRGMNQRDPLVHAVPAKHGQGWGNHLGFDEMHVEFVRCLKEKREPLTSIRNCVDGTLLAIAAEESIKCQGMVELGE